jgi:hypothetical protein
MELSRAKRLLASAQFNLYDLATTAWRAYQCAEALEVCGVDKTSAAQKAEELYNEFTARVASVKFAATVFAYHTLSVAVVSRLRADDDRISLAELDDVVSTIIKE